MRTIRWHDCAIRTLRRPSEGKGSADRGLHPTTPYNQSFLTGDHPLQAIPIHGCRRLGVVGGAVHLLPVSLACLCETRL